MKHRTAFTIVELLVVVTILAVLVSILVPSLQSARRRAVRALCVTNLHAIRTGCETYSADWDQRYPYRPPGGYLPHTIWVEGSFNLNETFVHQYVARRDQAMFCPGPLKNVRSPQALGWDQVGGYAYRYVTYTYYNFKPTFGNWLLDRPYPDMSKAVHSAADLPLWGCLTVDKRYAYLAHDVPETPQTPLGMNVVGLDGSGRWVDWKDMQPFWNDGSQDFFWPTPDWEPLN